MTNNSNLTFAQCMDLFCGVGEFKTFIKGIDPNKKYPGTTWQKMPEGTILMSGKDKLSQTNKFIMTIAQMPKHSHTRGTMEISSSGIGAFIYGDGGYDNNGALRFKRKWGSSAWSTGSGAYCELDFYASRTWTGATSEVGESKAVDLAEAIKHPECDIWLRIS